MLQRLINSIKLFFATRKPIITQKDSIGSNSGTSITSLGIDTLTQDKAAQVQEISFFKEKNNLIMQGNWEEPPLIYTPMGNYYGPNDKRNTYDPSVKTIIEDYDGKLISIGESTKEVYKKEYEADEDYSTVHEEEKQRLLEAHKKWAEDNKVVQYKEGL